MTGSDKTGCQSEVICELVKSSITQAQKSHNAYIEMNEKIHAQPGSEEDGAFHQKALDLAKQDAGENFKFALKILDVSDEAEAIRLQDEHANRQSEEMARRVSELQAMAGMGAGATAADDPVAAEAPVAEETTQSSDDTAKAVAAAAAVALGTGVALAADSDDGAEPENDQGSAEISEAVTKETASENSIEAEIEALATKIHEAKNIAAQTPAAGRDEAVQTVAEDAAAQEVVETVEETPVVVEAVEKAVEAPAAGEVAEAVVETPVTENVAETSVVVEAVAEAPVVVETVAEAPVLAEVAEAVVEAPVAEKTAEAVVEETEAASDSFDTDLSARLDAVRAMLQGSSS
jgi:hypothetical protein